MKIFTLLLGYLLLALILPGCGRPLLINAPLDTIEASLDRTTPQLMEKHDVVGLSVAVIRNGKLALSRTYGFGDLESKTALNERSIFKAASLGKPIFAYIVAGLAQQGKIDLDELLMTYDVPPAIKHDPRSQLITARMVLTHTTGLPNLGKPSKALAFQFTPGEDFLYSGHAFQYLQKAIELITSKSLNQLAEEQVFLPLEMTQSSYSWKPEYQTHLSQSYDNKKNAFTVKQEASTGHAAWSLYTTVSDYRKFILHMINEAETPNSIASQLITAQTDVAKGVKWGLGWGIQDTHPNRSIWHWGSMAGFRHYVVAYPKEKTAVIVMSNSQKAFKIIEDVMGEAIGGNFPSYNWF